jgi:imidazolonepropionase-like amidohydrolase
MAREQNRRSFAVTGGTVMDGNGGTPLKDSVILIEGNRITAVGGRDMPLPSDIHEVDARGKFVIPGLMNANVHLFGVLLTLERLARHLDNPDEIIVEAAQVALKSGQTTVFDTWGPRRFLMKVRDDINSGKVVGSRFFCAGNIVGFDGPLSADFVAKASEVVTSIFAKRVNSIFVENVGRHLMWLTPAGVAKEVRAYITKGIDFIKYGSNEHYWASAGAFLAFSTRAQTAIVEETHRAGLTAQAHSMSVEGLHAAVESGCDLVTHCNITGPTAIPNETLELMAKRRTGAVIFPQSEKQMQWIKEKVSDIEWLLWQSTDINARNLIQSGAPLLLANDGCLWPPEVKLDPWLSKSWVSAPEESNLGSLGQGHFFWFEAMEEKGCRPMDMLQAATKNIAIAYKKEKDLGTIEKGKLADLVILDKDPLIAAANYRTIYLVIKDGAVIDRTRLPEKPILSAGLEAPPDEEASYIAAIPSGPRLPMCPMCICR